MLEKIADDRLADGRVVLAPRDLLAQGAGDRQYPLRRDMAALRIIVGQRPAIEVLGIVDHQQMIRQLIGLAGSVENHGTGRLRPGRHILGILWGDRRAQGHIVLILNRRLSRPGTLLGRGLPRQRLDPRQRRTLAGNGQGYAPADRQDEKPHDFGRGGQPSKKMKHRFRDGLQATTISSFIPS